MKKYKSIYKEGSAPFKEGDRVIFLSTDGLQTIDTVYDIWETNGKWSVELKSTEQVISGKDIKNLKKYKGK